MGIPAGTVACKICAETGISLLNGRKCHLCDGHGFRPNDPKRILECKLCVGGGISVLSGRLCDACQGYGKVAPPSYVQMADAGQVRGIRFGRIPKASPEILGWALSVIEASLFVAAAVFGLLWVTASQFNYEAWAALFLTLGGGIELLRRWGIGTTIH
jgi:hypothetical protein